MALFESDVTMMLMMLFNAIVVWLGAASFTALLAAGALGLLHTSPPNFTTYVGTPRTRVSASTMATLTFTLPGAPWPVSSLPPISLRNLAWLAVHPAWPLTTRESKGSGKASLRRQQAICSDRLWLCRWIKCQIRSCERINVNDAMHF
jgi:hypothetical protein